MSGMVSVDRNDITVILASAHKIISDARERMMMGAITVAEGRVLRDLSIEAATIVTLLEKFKEANHG